MSLPVRTRHLAAFALSVFFVAAPLRAFAQVPQRLTDEQFWKLSKDSSEEDGVFRSDNLLSNETTYQWILPQLVQMAEQGRVYIGVGPEQNFTYVVAMRPRIAFIFDILISVPPSAVPQGEVEWFEPTARTGDGYCSGFLMTAMMSSTEAASTITAGLETMSPNQFVTAIACPSPRRPIPIRLLVHDDRNPLLVSSFLPSRQGLLSASACFGEWKFRE
jgi:hypothetical protein